MVSLWRSKKANDQDDPDSIQEPNEPREPDERTRLLSARHPPPRHGGYLDPDDPAVCSPTNTDKPRSCSNRLGLPVQSLGSPLPPFLDRSVPSRNLPLVVAVIRLHIR